MNKADQYYIKNLNNIMLNGTWDENPRPKWSDGTPAHSKFITQVFEEYDISKGEFPITTLRNTGIKTGIREILWIYQKQNNKLSVAHDLGVNWWDEWDIGDGTIGNRYGSTVKTWGLIDKLLNSLVNDPFSRRHIMNMYQESDLTTSPGLHPCAYETIWSVRSIGGEKVLDMTLIQRSNDYIAAGFINKIQYVGLMMMVAGHCGYKMGKFCHLIQNLHIYDRHFDAVNEILEHTPKKTDFPFIELTSNKNFYDYTIDDFLIHNVSDIKKLTTPLEIAI